MTIEITNEGELFHIYKDGQQRPIKNFRQSINTFAFYDEDIENLIGEKAYNSTFQQGKYKYNVSAKHLQLITGERGAQNKNELLMYKN